MLVALTGTPGTGNPRWMETFQPIISANDPNTITHLGLGKNAYTLADRRLHFNHVTYYNSLCACVLPVVHYESLEAYDRTSFSGWMPGFGGINNVWSFGSLKQPRLGPLSVSISAFTKSVTSGGTTTVQVAVSDAGGAAVGNATVALTTTSGSLNPASGLTNPSGRFQTTWTAPTVSQDADVTVTATVNKTQYVGAVVWTALTAHAPFRPLDVSVVVGQAILNSSVSTSVTVTVSSLGAPVGDVDVSLRLSLPGGTLSPYTGRTGSTCPSATCGVFTSAFVGNPSVRSIYRIDVSASKPGYVPFTGPGGSVIVTPPPNDTTKFTRVTTTVPGFETLAVLAAIGAAVAVLRWRNRREG